MKRRLLGIFTFTSTVLLFSTAVLWAAAQLPPVPMERDPRFSMGTDRAGLTVTVAFPIGSRRQPHVFSGITGSFSSVWVLHTPPMSSNRPQIWMKGPVWDGATGVLRAIA